MESNRLDQNAIVRPIASVARRSFFFGAMFAAAMAVCGHPCAAATAHQAPYVMMPGVVVDPDRCVVYMMNPGGGIDVVEVSSGALLWSTRAAAKPLALAGSRLVAQAEPHDAGVLQLVVLDTSHAGAVIARARIPLPEGATALIEDAPGKTFELQGRIRGDEIEVAWRFTSRRIGGVAAPGGSMKTSELEGAALVDIKSKRVTTLPEHRFAREPDGERQDVSADGRFVITARRGAADAQGLPTYSWAIRERGTGKLVSEMQTSISYAPFFICRNVLVFRSPPARRRVDGRWIEHPLELRAFHFGRRSLLWSRALRDTTFRGPSPP